MPRSYASQFRVMVVEQVRSGRRVAEVADLWVPETCSGCLVSVVGVDVGSCDGGVGASKLT